MRFRTMILTFLAALALAASASAALARKYPLSLALHQQDCPAGGKFTIGQLPDEFVRTLPKLGIRADGAYGACGYARTKAGSITLTFFLLATQSPGQARKAFALFTKELAGPSKTKVALPTYGDQQLTVVDRDGTPAELLVRTNSIVWDLSLEANGVKVLTRTQAISELKRFALKQKAHVGAGR